MKKIMIIGMLLMTLTACNFSTKYIVTFDTQGFDTPNQMIVEEAGFITLPVDVNREGYVFDGWYQDQAFVDLFDETQPINQDITIYGKWVAVYDVVFDTQGGSMVESITVKEGDTIVFPEDPVLEGHYFGGWFTGPLSTTVIDENYVVTVDVTVYGRWFENFFSYQITLMNGDDVVDVFEAKYGNKSPLPDLEKEGFNFRGWYVDEALTTRFSYEGSYTEDTVLYAKFSPIQSVAYFVFENLLLIKKTVNYGENLDLSDMNFDMEGFEFIGWYSDYQYQNEVTSITGGTQGQYIFAKYELVEESIDLTSLGYYDLLSSNNPLVTITTNVGVMELELFPSIAPNTVHNFIKYIQDGAYSNSTFHRIIYDFMIQGGIVETTTCPIKGDFSSNGVVNDLSHTRGVLSMARTNVADSATSQFFIVQADSTFLDGNYAAFGGLVSGFNVMDLISIKPKNSYDQPYIDVVIQSMTVELNGYVVEDVICAE